MVYIRSISSLPSLCLWGLGFLSPVFLLLMYGYIWARVPGLSLYSMEKRKITLKFKVHLTYLSAPAWGWPSVGVEQLPLPSPGAHKGWVMCACVAEPALGYTTSASSHTRAAGAAVPLGWGSLRIPSGLGQTLDAPSIRSTHPEGLVQLRMFRPVWNALGYLR